MIKKNKILLIGVYCVIGILAIATLLCSVLKTNYRPEINDPYIINIQDGSYAKYIAASKENNTETYDKILKEFNDSFNETVLTSIFSGKMSFNSNIVEYGRSNPNTNFKGFKVEFAYEEEKTIMLNGKEYNPPTNTSKTINYEKIIFDVNEEKGMTRHYIYYVSYDKSTQKNTYYQQSVMCDFTNLYTLLLTY